MRTYVRLGEPPRNAKLDTLEPNIQQFEQRFYGRRE